MDDQLQIYQQVILDHNRKPKNFRQINDATYKIEGFNPLCGDHLWVYCVVDKNKTITDISFDGHGCAISKASASMMTASLRGKSVTEAVNMFHQFQQLLTHQISPDTENNKLGKLNIFSGIWKYPSRVKCAGLAWHALHSGLSGGNDCVSTEGTDDGTVSS
ncbi:MAG: SUF system NifU family Fe-S cluster assembly protein [Zetaproteobacteria bacterium]|nr:SUF system NifU family Fe-S cluster assembly protein [Zetaproteobacteria bacterium]